MSAETDRPSPWVTALLLTVLAELVLLGSGRLLQLGPLTLRMWLYLLCLACALVLVLRHGSIDRDVMLLGLGFVTVTTASSAIGLLNHAPIEQVVEDVKPLLFFLMIFFFGAAIRHRDQARQIATLMRLAALLLGIGYIGVWLLVFLKVLPFKLVYSLLSGTGEFFFRGESGTFYKGFLHLGVGLCFFLAGGRWSKLAVALLFLAILLTFTRGLLLATILVIAIAIVLRERRLPRLPVYGALLVGGIIAAWPWMTKAFANRGASDASRLIDVRVVERSATWASVVVGHGLGKSVGDQARIEASYLQILHQQGVIGLLLWLSVAVLLTRDYWRAAKQGRMEEALPFYLGALFVFVESATNPFLTNPIGMSIVLVALVVLKLLATTDPSARITPPQPA